MAVRRLALNSDGKRLSNPGVKSGVLQLRHEPRNLRFWLPAKITKICAELTPVGA
jgi:hypothetical protein